MKLVFLSEPPRPTTTAASSIFTFQSSRASNKHQTVCYKTIKLRESKQNDCECKINGKFIKNLRIYSNDDDRSSCLAIAHEYSTNETN